MIQSTILKLSRGIDDVKAELHDALKKAVNFQPHLNNSLELKSRIEQLSSDIQDLSNKIQNEVRHCFHSLPFLIIISTMGIVGKAIAFCFLTIFNSLPDKRPAGLLSCGV